MNELEQAVALNGYVPIDVRMKRRFSVGHGRICLSNNAAERGARGIALGRKSWLFCGSDRGGERAAVMYSLIVTAKMNDIDPQAWLADVLGRIALELAWAQRAGKSGRLTMAGISYVFTISRVAEMLGEDEEWLDEISIVLVVSAFSASAKNRQPPLHASASITSLSSCRSTKPIPAYFRALNRTYNTPRYWPDANHSSAGRLFAPA